MDDGQHISSTYDVMTMMELAARSSDDWAHMELYLRAEYLNDAASIGDTILKGYDGGKMDDGQHISSEIFAA